MSALPVWAGGTPTDGIAALRVAALAGDPALAEAWVADDMMLISQSGKVYGRTETLADIDQGFITWDNRDLKLVEDAGGVRATYINRRTRTGQDGTLIPATDFRVVQMWQKRGDDWKLVLQASVRLPK